MKRLPIIVLAFAIIVAACGGDEGGEGDTTTTTTTSATTTTTAVGLSGDQRILEVRYEGGFAPIEFLLSRTPRFTLYADGRLVYEGPIAAIFPGPLMPNLQVVDIGVDGLSDVLTAVQASGLPDITEVVNNDASDFVADASNTVITYTDENGDHVYNVYALGITEGDVQLDSLQRIVDILDQLSATSPSVGAYPVERMQVVVSEAFNAGDPEATVEPWPLAAAPADFADFLMDTRCTVVEGDEAAEVLPVLQNANQMTFFESGGTDYRLTVRPLLAGEEGCVSST